VSEVVLLRLGSISVQLRAKLLLGAWVSLIATAALACTVSPIAPPNWGVGSPALNEGKSGPADSGVIIVDGEVRLEDGGAEGSVPGP
jgi:hypothetical protein